MLRSTLLCEVPFDLGIVDRGDVMFDHRRSGDVLTRRVPRRHQDGVNNSHSTCSEAKARTGVQARSYRCEDLLRPPRQVLQGSCTKTVNRHAMRHC
jgi:hypothetical protein